MRPGRHKSQLSFGFAEAENAFGGSLLKHSNARSPRPLSTKHALHLVMRASVARGDRSFLKRENARYIQSLVHSKASLYGVRIYRYVNVGNHLHLLVRPQNRRTFKAFLRVITGLIARRVLERERGVAAKAGGGTGATRASAGQAASSNGKAEKKRFWDQRPFTRIVAWGKAYQAAARYLMKNKIDALGFGKIIPMRLVAELREKRGASG